MSDEKQIEALVVEAAVIVRQAGRRLVEGRDEIGKVTGHEEGGREVKLLADQVTNDVILDTLRKTGLGILSEEAGWQSGTGECSLKWVVDPLDGSFNYLRGVSYCGVSVGLCDGDRPVAGLIYDLNRQVLVTGIVGKGAYAEDQAISVSKVSDPSRAVLTTGFPARMNYDAENLAGFIAQVRSFQKIRMLGSAVQSCLGIAMGWLDAYYEQDVMLWDVAAGLAIIESAGGFYRLGSGGREHACEIWACTPGLKAFDPGVVA